MFGIRKVISTLTQPFRPDPPVAPLVDWNMNPYLHPLEAAHGYAGHLVDLKRHDFIDLSSAWGANLLGYGYPRVAAAIAAQAQRFAILGLPYPEFRELGRLLCEIIPGAEEIRYGKNGSDVTLGAVRLARAITRREKILHRGYHGFHDWWMASTPCQGIPEALRELIIGLPDLTPEAVDRAFAAHPGQVAALIIDPMLQPYPTVAAVREIVEIVHRHGALMIFDEVVSGFRIAPGGAQERWGVLPDLSCFGKAIANGLPLSVLAGREEHMSHLPGINYGMTFEGESISIAAALATLHEILEQKVCDALAAKGRFLKEAYGQLALRHGVETRLDGWDARPFFSFTGTESISERELRWLLIQTLAHDRVLTVGTFNLCFSHTDTDLRAIVAACDQGLRLVRQAIEQGSTGGLLDERLLLSLQ